MYTLYIANKNYSSWSLRGWLCARLSGAPFEEILVQLATGGPNPACISAHIERANARAFASAGHIPG